MIILEYKKFGNIILLICIFTLKTPSLNRKFKIFLIFLCFFISYTYFSLIIKNAHAYLKNICTGIIRNYRYSLFAAFFFISAFNSQ